MAYFHIVPPPGQRAAACALAPALRMLYSPKGRAVVFYVGPCPPDGLDEGCMPHTLTLEEGEDPAEPFAAFVKRAGRPPSLVLAKGLGVYALGDNMAKALMASSPLTGQSPPVGEPDTSAGRLAGKIAIVTGGAQGFGKGIAEHLAAQGAYVAVADLNLEGARSCAGELVARFGSGRALGVEVNVADEQSVQAMVEETVLVYGGLDLLVSNAGIAIAGSLTEMDCRRFELVTSVNYTGYFLCVQAASLPMKVQRRYSSGYTADIIEINSKSGLVGSNKNFAYAGSKFGGVGLTQSFALELVEFGIKVNAVCPGNLLDGPLWSDPEKGLFRQYFDAGKVPGAKSVADVRAFYEAKVPMKRGCTIPDVARAIFYLVEQQYETGQALPVTGGQVMLK